MGSFVWSDGARDPMCTEGPCAQDLPLILGGAIVVALVAVYLLFLASEARTARHDRGR